jgi:hypothetical protein
MESQPFLLGKWDPNPSFLANGIPTPPSWQMGSQPFLLGKWISNDNIRSVKKWDVDLLLDLNTQHDFQYNPLLYLAFAVCDEGHSRLLDLLKQTIFIGFVNEMSDINEQ